jgi:hypothetical protein
MILTVMKAAWGLELPSMRSSSLLLVLLRQQLPHPILLHSLQYGLLLLSLLLALPSQLLLV